MSLAARGALARTAVLAVAMFLSACRLTARSEEPRPGSVHAPPAPAPSTASLYAVWGTRAEKMFAVGAGGTVLRYGGGQWSAMARTTLDDLYVAGASGVVLRRAR